MTLPIFRVLILIFVALIASACGTDMSRSSWANDMIGDNYYLVQDSVIAKKNCSLLEQADRSYVIQTRTNFDRSGISTAYGCKPVIVATMKSGEIIQVTKIFHVRDGTNGHCWWVYGRNLNGAVFDIPSCRFKHQRIWVETLTDKSDLEPQVGFRFRSEYLKKVE